jgi:Secretion system C-terminal sorting domain/Polysaccharide deacetylase
MNKAILFLILLSLVGLKSFSQKITILLDDNPNSTPTITKAPFKYNKDFAYSFTLDDATVDAFNHALPVLQGGAIKEVEAIFPGFYYTDGCGNSFPFKSGIAWNTASINGEDAHTGEVKGLLTWKQLDSLYALGWDVFNHSFSHKSRWLTQMNNTDYTDEILKNQVGIREKTTKKIDTPVFVVPSGDDTYQDIALQLGSKIVFDQSGNVTGFGGLQVDGDINLNNLKIHRQTLNEGAANYIVDKIADKAQNGGHYWYNEFTHRIDDFDSGGANFYSFKNQMQKIATTWGKNGSDRVWMAPLQEVFEYLVFRQSIRYTTSISNKKIEINIDASNVPTWLRRKTLTFIVNSTSSFSQVDASASIKKSFRGSGNVKIINLDFTNYAPSTSIQEAPPSVFKLFPNPANNILNVEIMNDWLDDSQFTITDISGKSIITSNMTNKKQNIDISKLSQGVYFFKLTQQQNSYVSKFIKI